MSEPSWNNERVEFIDSHTAGEPTRVVVGGGPDLGRGTLAERRQRFAEQSDTFRAAVVNEPRGSDVWVGALLCEPVDPSCVTGVIYFNNVGCLQMCGHATIGVAVTLGRLGRIGPGEHRIETPVGVVRVQYDGAYAVAFENVLCYRHRADLSIEVEGLGRVAGEVAWGGNWFFLADAGGRELELANVDQLTDVAWRIRRALQREGMTGTNNAEIDHIELSGPPRDSGADSRNFVLCPGGAFDRSPCGTGTSAKMACLAAEGRLADGQIWRQEGILGTQFEGWVERREDGVLPWIRGSAYVTAEGTLILDPNDPFRNGIRP